MDIRIDIENTDAGYRVQLDVPAGLHHITPERADQIAKSLTHMAALAREREQRLAAFLH